MNKWKNSTENERKRPALVLENLRGSWSDCETSSPLPLIASITDGFARLVASIHPFDLATLETLLVRGRVFAMAVRTDGFARLVASLYRFDLATLETLLVRGRVSVTSRLIAVRTDGFAGLPVLMDDRLLCADTTSTLHGLTSFLLWAVLEKSEFRSPDLVAYPTGLMVVCQSPNPKSNQERKMRLRTL